MNDETSSTDILLAQRKRVFCPLTGYRRQRQMLAALFRELALGVRHKCPLDLLAEGIAASPRLHPGAKYLHLGLLLLLGAVAAALGYWELYIQEIFPKKTFPLGSAILVIGGGLLLYCFSVRPHEDFVRHVAGRLADSLAQGRTLSEAMWGQPLVFSRQECQVVIVGEQSGHLAESLESLADYNLLSVQMGRIAGSILYPVFVLAACLVLSGFVLARVSAGYATVFRQVGVTMPGLSQSVLSGVPSVLIFVLSILAIPVLALLAAVLFFVWIPRMLAGSAVLTVLFMIAMALACGAISLGISTTFMDEWDSTFGIKVTFLAASFAAGGLITLAGYFVIRWLSSILPRTAGALASAVLGWLSPLRKLEMSRFLYSLGYSLRARVPVPEALEMAGYAVRGRLRREAIRFRAMVDGGHSIADCLKAGKCFPAQVVAILSLAEWRGSIADDCVELAGQLHAQADRSSRRLAALIEWPSIVLVGIILCAFAMAIYLPIFRYPIALLEKMP